MNVPLIYDFYMAIRRRLHNEELHSLYRSPNIVKVIKYRRLRWAAHVARMEEGSLTGTPAVKRALRRPRRRREDSFRMDLTVLGINTRNYWRALVNSELNLRVS